MIRRTLLVAAVLGLASNGVASGGAPTTSSGAAHGSVASPLRTCSAVPARLVHLLATKGQCAPGTGPAAGAADAPLDPLSCGRPDDTAPRCPAAVDAEEPGPRHTPVAVTSPDGRTVHLLAAYRGQMHVLVSVDSRTGRRTATTLLRLRENSYLGGAALSDDGRLLLAGGTTEVGALAYLVDLRARRLVWVRYLDRRGYYDSVNAVAVHGDRALLATGRKERAGTYTDDWLVMGLDLRTGRTVWSSRHGKAEGLDQYPTGAVVTATGRLVVAGNEVRKGRQDYDAVVRVYDPATGRLLRTEFFSPEGGELNEDWWGIALSPDRQWVGLVGNTSDWTLNGRATAEVLDADGLRLWRQVITSPTEMQGYGATWAGGRLVAATEQWAAPPLGYLTPAYAAIASTVVAFDGRRGTELWRTTTGEAGTTLTDTVTTSPDGSRVYALGMAGLVYGWVYQSAGVTVAFVRSPADAYSVALDAGTGAVRWTSRWNGNDAGADYTYLFAAAATRHGLVAAGVNLASTTRYLPNYLFLNEAAPLFLRFDL